jgi:signal transduction histidine kinase
VDGADARIRYALHLLGKLLPYHRCALLHTAPDRGEVLLLADDTPEARAAMGPPLRYLFGLLSEQAEQAEQIDRAEPAGSTGRTRSSASSFVTPNLPELSSWGAHLAAPLVSLDQVVGVLVVQRAGEPYGEEDLGVLSVVASQLASYLTTLELREQERQRAREVEAARRREAFLASASHALASSLDYDTTLAEVARLAVPTVAELCAVHVREEGRPLRCAAVAHVNPSTELMLREILSRASPRLGEVAEAVDPVEGETPNPIALALRTGQAQLLPDAPDTLILAIDHAPRVHAVQGLNVHSALVVPLTARGHTFGTITFATGAGGHRYGPADLPVAESLAARCALAVDNARLHTQAQAGLRLRDAVLAMVSHDLKNPLAAIQGHAQLLQRQLSRLDVPNRERLVAGAANTSAAAARMGRQIDELLDVARLGAGEVLKLERTPTDLVAVARRVASRLGRLARNHRLFVQADPEPIIGQWDVDRLERVFDNLIGNAIKYSPEGGEVHISITLADDDAVLSVRDQGVGIPAEDLPFVFEPFRRGANVLEHIRGSGLGLASVRAIVEQHGGTISVTSSASSPPSREGDRSTASQPEGGSTFTVRLPLSGLVARPPTAESSGAATT